MTEKVQTALACSRLLLQLARVQVTEDSMSTASYRDIKDGLKALHKSYGIRFKQRKLRHHKLTAQDLPLAFLAVDGVYRILAKLEQDQVLVQHPFKSQSELWSQQQLHSCWDNQVITLAALSLKFNLAWFIPAFWVHRRMLAEVLLFSLVLQLLALILPLFFQVIMDKVLNYKVVATLDVLIIVLIITGIFEVLLRILREYQYTHTAKRVDILLGIKLVKRLLSVPILYFKHRSVGALVARVRELDSIREFLSSSFFTLGIDISFMVVFLAVMWHISSDLTFISIATLPLYIAIAWRVTKPLQAKLETQFRCSAANTAFLSETIAGAETVKSLAVEPRLTQRWERQTRDLVDAGYRTQLLSSLADHLVQGVGKVASALILWKGARLVIDLNITLGQLIAFNMLSQHFAQPLAKLVELWRKFVQAKVAIDILSDTLNAPSEQETKGVEHKIEGAITLQQVTFCYRPGAPQVLQGISLHIQAGTHLGIVGESGSGKSTLARLLLRLYLPEQGEICIDGIPLSSIDVGNLRRQMAVVLQENYLFHRTVRDNIALAMPEASLESVIKAAQLAGAHDFILRLPMGYDTMIAEGGRSLSGGQRQRIAIARALLSIPKILIFDEATSALDEESQALIQSNMAKIAHNRTVITIAHRLSAVQRCDCIIVLHQGNIIEQGAHQQLLALKGKYAYLWNLQQDLQLAHPE